jgi:deoxyribodipyrimidine photo-lyase
MEKNKLFELSLFIFRRDLRLIDNTALLLASKQSKNIIPAFFLDYRQVDKSKNPYHSSNSIQFMCESLADLNNRLKEFNSMLFIFHGDLIKNLEDLIKTTKINSVFVNQDYTPFSLKRDEEIKKLCDQYNVKFNSSEDIILTDLNSVKTKAGSFSKVFTPYFRAASQVSVRKVDNNIPQNFLSDTKLINSIKNKLVYKNEFDLLELLNINNNKHVEIKGGRKYGEEKLKNLKSFAKYEQTRNFPIISSTRLSAYLKFGVVSAREVFHQVKDLFGANHDIIKQLHWRDFYTKISYFYPHVIGHSMKDNLDSIKWLAEEKHIEAWKNGMTGCPIVDAAMRCLNTTGFMHNRLRMITGSYFVKDLIADWKIGEKYFANNLIDYDISLNNGGWQWVASTGTDSQPYFRIFNPALQSEKFDKNCEFIKKWLPELKNVPNDHIHFWEDNYKKYKGKVKYPDPIVVHNVQKEKVLKLYKVYSKELPEKEETSKESKKTVKGKNDNCDIMESFTSRKRKADSDLNENDYKLVDKLKKNQKKK